MSYSGEHCLHLFDRNLYAQSKSRMVLPVILFSRSLKFSSVQIKEVSPVTSRGPSQQFWRHDVRIARDYNATMGERDGEHLRYAFLIHYVYLRPLWRPAQAIDISRSVYSQSKNSRCKSRIFSTTISTSSVMARGGHFLGLSLDLAPRGSNQKKGLGQSRPWLYTI